MFKNRFIARLPSRTWFATMLSVFGTAFHERTTD
jgi:hypothetical protein